MTLPSPAAAPPMRLPSPPSTFTPTPFPSALTPSASVPIRLPCTMLSSSPTSTASPSPEIRLSRTMLPGASRTTPKATPRSAVPSASVPIRLPWISGPRADLDLEVGGSVAGDDVAVRVARAADHVVPAVDLDAVEPVRQRRRAGRVGADVVAGDHVLVA